VTVLRTSLPYRRYEVVMKRYLARRFAKHRWHLFVDADERFDYPLADRVPLSSLIRYLDAGGYRALVAQMLDLFPDQALADLTSEADFERRHIFYDLADIEKTPYIWGAEPGSDLRMHWGGIRRQVFGTRNGLTKVALARGDDDVELFVGWHHMRGARIAKLTGLFRHYPFAGPFTAKVRDAVRGQRFGSSASHEYKRYWKVLTKDPRRRLRSSTAVEWAGVSPLVEQQFIVVPDDYVHWAAQSEGWLRQLDATSHSEGLQPCTGRSAAEAQRS